MFRVLLITVFVIAVVMLVHAQEDDQNQATVEMTEQQNAALLELELAEEAYDTNKFTVARRHAEKAFELDPSNSAGLIIIARSIRALYRVGNESPANVVKARDAIAAYLRVPAGPDDDEVYNAIKGLYGAIGENDLQYTWVMQRANNSGLPASTRAEAYVDLASFDLKCSIEIAEKVTERLYVEETDTMALAPLDWAAGYDIARGHETALRGIQMAHQATELASDNDKAWNCEVDLLKSIARLYELEGNDSKAKETQALSQAVAAKYSDLKVLREDAARARMISVDCDSLCSNVINTPRPLYPPIARAARAEGEVVVGIQINTDGHVISATALSGHPLLRAAAVQAARLSSFSPFLNSGVPKNNYGILTYNFTIP